MATHDYVIDNQSASAFRSDLNGALQAIVTQNSSATAPTTTYANMLWYDTANNQIKKRNEANSTWIILGTINEGTGTFTPSGERALASQAQAEAGTDNTTIMTPLRTQQLINVDFVGSSGSSGYRWINGTLIQWGRSATISGESTITFPIAFPTACRQGFATPYRAGAVDGNVSAYFQAISTAQASVTNDGSGGSFSSSIQWLAVGD